MSKKSKKSNVSKPKDLNKDKGTLQDPLEKIIDYGEIPANTPQGSQEKK